MPARHGPKPIQPSATLSPTEKENTPSTSQTNGLRAHLHHLLPRHALFQAEIEIHQISSVPLVRGEFAVRWKLKHCVAAPSAKQGFFKLKSRSPNTSSNGSQLDLDLKTKEEDNGRDADAVSVSSSASPDNASIISSNEEPSPFAPIPTVIVSEDSTSSASSTPRPTPSRGQTTFLPLREHSVTWSQRLSLHLKIPLSRDRENPDVLMPSPAKFVVIQRVVAGDPDAPRNPRLGVVYLDLAEYAGPTVGEVSRRYLLRDSKTNTTLKLSIKLTHVGGEKNYVAPPLPKGEILTGLSGLLENDIYNTRPSAFDMYGRYVEENNRRDSDVDSNSEDFVPLDVSRLPLAYAYGPKTTETLIEALFNPVQLPVSLKPEGKLNPFVQYVPDS